MNILPLEQSLALCLVQQGKNLLFLLSKSKVRLTKPHQKEVPHNIFICFIDFFENQFFLQ